MNYSNFIQPYEKEEEISNDVLIERIKVWRKQELANSDYTQLPDVLLLNKSEWSAYRQSLRDLPEQGLDPKLWVFPVAPT